MSDAEEAEKADDQDIEEEIIEDEEMEETNFIDNEDMENMQRNMPSTPNQGRKGPHLINKMST